MKTYQFDDLTIHIHKKGVNRYDKASYPIRYGTYSEIESGPFVFQFNENGEIRHALCKKGCPMEPTEWLKRTVGNDWVFYSSGGYNGAFEAVGEYYVPCFPYESNGILGGKPFKEDIVHIMESSLSGILRQIGTDSMPSDPELHEFCDSVQKNDPSTLKKKADEFHRVTDGVISVLPPDARHVDYDVIPLNIARGCLYNCRFCTVKSGQGFSRMTSKDIDDQITGLKKIYGKDIINYNSIFIGQHDALHAGADLIERAALTGYQSFGFETSNMLGPRLFLFASADSFLSASEKLFETLNRLPFECYINIGLESADEQTLKQIGKPITVAKVKEAFSKMAHINRTCQRVEITANFLYGDSLPDTHMDAFFDLVHDQYPRPYTKGAVYLSPFGRIKNRKSLVSGFKVIKNNCGLPAYLYIIQRL